MKGYRRVNGMENHLINMFKELIPSYMTAVNDILNGDVDGEDEVRVFERVYERVY